MKARATIDFWPPESDERSVNSSAPLKLTRTERPITFNSSSVRLPEPTDDGVEGLEKRFFYFFRNTQLEMHLLEGPDKGHSTSEGK